MKRKICVVVTNRASYGRIKYLLKALKEHNTVELQLIVSASMLLSRFGNAVKQVRNDGFEPTRTLYYILEGETLATQAKSTGFGIIELSTVFEQLTPDLVVTVADRFETMATAVAATYMNIPLAHIQGGEVSGNIDDLVRHSVTKMSKIHFPSTEESKERIIKMGEDPDHVFNFGCPSVDLLVNDDLAISNERMSGYQVIGNNIDFSQPYVLMVQHPVTTSYGEGRAQVEETLNALAEFKQYQKIVLWPNVDAGMDEVSKGIRVFRENHREENFNYFINFDPEDYAAVLNNAKCCVGNSSSFIREGGYLGVPAVMIGDRQEGREHGENVVYCGYSGTEITEAVSLQSSHKRFESSKKYGAGKSGTKIAEILVSIDLDFRKMITY